MITNSSSFLKLLFSACQSIESVDIQQAYTLTPFPSFIKFSPGKNQPRRPLAEVSIGGQRERHGEAFETVLQLLRK